MKKCPECGVESADDRLFCSGCGMKLVEVQSKPEPKPEPKSEPKSEPKPMPVSTSKFDPLQVPTNISQESKQSSEDSLAHRQSKIFRRLNIILGILTLTFGIAAFVFAYEMNVYKGAYSDARSELYRKRMEVNDLRRRLGGLDKIYGGNVSSGFYADQNVVIVRESETTEVTIYRPRDTVVYATCCMGFTWEWNGGYGADVLTGYFGDTATITGISAGYYTANLTNDQNSDSFEVLVIVTE